MLSYRYWRERLGGDTAIIGKTVEMTDRLHTVVGVLPPLPDFPNENDVFMPISSCPFRISTPWLTRRDFRQVSVFGVVRPGVSLTTVRSELNGIATRCISSMRRATSPRADLASVPTRSSRSSPAPARETLVLLLATSGFVLLIACANVANLTLVRLVHRRAEWWFALRSEPVRADLPDSC